jgi:hypothetical protein
MWRLRSCATALSSSLRQARAANLVCVAPLPRAAIVTALPRSRRASTAANSAGVAVGSPASVSQLLPGGVGVGDSDAIRRAILAAIDAGEDPSALVRAVLTDVSVPLTPPLVTVCLRTAIIALKPRVLSQVADLIAARGVPPSLDVCREAVLMCKSTGASRLTRCGACHVCCRPRCRSAELRRALRHL